jgi:hypothetical protein
MVRRPQSSSRKVPLAVAKHLSFSEGIEWYGTGWLLRSSSESTWRTCIEFSEWGELCRRWVFEGLDSLRSLQIGSSKSGCCPSIEWLSIAKRNPRGRDARCIGARVPCKPRTLTEVSTGRSLPSCIPSAEQKTVIKAIAVNAAVTANQHQSQQEPPEFAAPSMTVYIVAATPGTLANAGPRFPHCRHAYECWLSLNRPSIL